MTDVVTGCKKPTSLSIINSTSKNVTYKPSQRFALVIILTASRGHAVAQVVEALRQKPEGRRFDSR